MWLSIVRGQWCNGKINIKTSSIGVLVYPHTRRCNRNIAIRIYPASFEARKKYWSFKYLTLEWSKQYGVRICSFNLFVLLEKCSSLAGTWLLSVSYYTYVCTCFGYFGTNTY